MRRQFTIPMAVILLLAMMLSACGGVQSQKQEYSVADTELLMQMSENGEPFDPWDSDYIGEPITLRMLSISANPRIVKAVNDFNRQSKKYQIELESLFPYDQLLSAVELDNAILKLNSQFISGDLPDIIDLYELPAEVYYSRGIIENLLPYLEADPGIKREDYYENILEAMMIDGGLPYVTNGVGFRTMIGPKELAGSEPGWTLAEMNAMLDEKGLTALGNLNGKVFINMMLYTHDFFVDWETGECHFTSDEFIRMLETAKRIQGAQVSDIVLGEYEPHYVSFEGITSFYHVAQFRDYYGEDLEFLGFPCESGEFHAIFPESRIAISYTCQDKVGAWKFIRTLLTDQQESCMFFPIKREAFDSAANSVIAGKTNDWSSSYANIKVEESDVALVRSLMERAHYPYSTNVTIQEIVLDELEKYFEGQESAQEAARFMERRVTIYLGEQT